MIRSGYEVFRGMERLARDLSRQGDDVPALGQELPESGTVRGCITRVHATKHFHQLSLGMSGEVDLVFHARKPTGFSEQRLLQRQGTFLVRIPSARLPEGSFMSLRNPLLWVGVVLLAGMATVWGAEEFGPPDLRRMVQVKTLRALPPDLVSLLGSGNRSPGHCGRRQAVQSDRPNHLKLPMRRFVVGGSSLAKVLVAYEQGGSEYSIRLAAFVLEIAGWKRTSEWTLHDKPSSLFDLANIVSPPAENPLWRTLGTRPRRRDGPFREINISDDEVREIQSVIRDVVPGAIVNISGVVVGCPCEDGAACTDQVWIVAYTPAISRGLQLSKIGDHWTVGPLQQWWLDYDDFFEAYRRGSSSWRTFTEAEELCRNGFPSVRKKPRAPRRLDAVQHRIEVYLPDKLVPA